MFRSVEINGYRGFSHYEMQDLGRVNLLVGKNNSGKTSVLEAAYLLGSEGDPAALWNICNRRGERFLGGTRSSRFEADVAHLFIGHELAVGQSISVRGRNESGPQSVNITVDDLPEQDRDQELDLRQDEDILSWRRLVLNVKSSALRRSQAIPLTPQGGLWDTTDLPRRVPARSGRDASQNVHFITTEAFNGNELIRHWDRIQLTPDESMVLDALRFVDFSVEQIRSLGPSGTYGPRGGFIVKRQGESSPFPLGSLGDGAWRILTMAIVLTQCAGGMLFIDEIDTGLHHTVMADMWRLIQVASRRFNVQVFASTHSYDCVHSLSTICRSGDNSGAEVTIQRIEADRPIATPFSEAEIRIAAERQIEIR